MPAGRKTKPQAPLPPVETMTKPPQEINLSADTAKNVIESPTSLFPIVGIGASAGGLAAFEAFFLGMPADTDPGMAFVLVQHLAPDHKRVINRTDRHDFFSFPV